MLVKALVENKLTNPHIKAQHGLSLYLETESVWFVSERRAECCFEKSSQIVLVDDLTHITPNLTLFSNVRGRKLFSPANENLYARQNGTGNPILY